MKATVLEPTPSKRTLEVEIPAEEVEKERREVARKYARAASVPGFRKGKTPPAMIRKRFAKEIQQEVVESLTKDSTWKLIEEHSLVPLEAPAVEEVSCKEGEPLKFRVTFDIRPAIELGQYKGLEVMRRRAEVSEDVIERNLQSLREASGHLQAVEGRALAEDDVAVADLQPLDDQGKPVGESRTNVQLDIREGGVPEELRSQLVGLEVGSSRDITVPAAAPQGGTPEENPASQRYELTLRAIRQKVLPELDDEFAKEQGDFESMEDLRKRLEADLNRRADQQADEEVIEQLLTQLVNSHDFTAPDVLVDQELDRMLQRLAEAMARSGVDPSESGMDWKAKREEMRPHAQRRARADMLLDDIARAEGLEIEDAEILDALQAEAERSKTSAAALKARLNKEGRLESLKIKMLRQKSLDLVEGSANIMNK